MKKKPLRAVIVGFGNVGQKLAAMLGEERGKYPGLAALDLEAVAVFTGRHGALVEPAGIRLADVLGRFRNGNAFPAAPMTVLQALETLDYDVLVELSTLDIERRGEPAVSHVRAALQRGKHAVTANKGPAAFAYRELAELAGKKQGAVPLRKRGHGRRAGLRPGRSAARLPGHGLLRHPQHHHQLRHLAPGSGREHGGRRGRRPAPGLRRGRPHPRPGRLGRGGQDRHPGQFLPGRGDRSPPCGAPGDPLPDPGERRPHRLRGPAPEAGLPGLARRRPRAGRGEAAGDPGGEHASP